MYYSYLDTYGAVFPYEHYPAPYIHFRSSLPAAGQQGDMQHPATYKSLEEALALIKQAVQSEREDEFFYDYLITVAPSKEEKDIIAGIRDDEQKHSRLLGQIYRDLTGQEAEPPVEEIAFEKPKTYIAGVKKAFFGELSAMERYRDIRAGLTGQYYRDIVFEILTDEMEHAAKYNYILNLDLSRKIRK